MVSTEKAILVVWAAGQVAIDVIREMPGTRRYTLLPKGATVILRRGMSPVPVEIEVGGTLAMRLLVWWPRDTAGRRRAIGARRIVALACGAEAEGAVKERAREIVDLYMGACGRAAALERRVAQTHLAAIASAWLDGGRLPSAPPRDGLTPRPLAWDSEEGLELALSHLEEDCDRLPGATRASAPAVVQG